MTAQRADDMDEGRPSTSTELAKLAEFERTGEWIPLFPIIVERTETGIVPAGARSPFLVENIGFAPITDVQKQTYKGFWCPDGHRAPKGSLLEDIARAAGVRVRDVDVKYERRPDGHVYYQARATVGVRQPNGEWFEWPAMRDLDSADLAEKWEAEYRKKNPRASDDQIADMVKQRLLVEKPTLIAKVKSYTINQGLRKVLGIEQSYPEAMLRQVGGFAVPRLALRPDLDPAQLEQMQLEGRRAAEGLWGAAALPEGRTPSVPPGGDLSDEDPDEEGEARGAGVETAPDAASSPAPPAGAQTASDGEGEASSSVTAGGASGDQTLPSDDPIVNDPGPYKGERMSRAVELDRGYAEAMATNARTKGLRDLWRAWLDYMYPTLRDDQ